MLRILVLISVVGIAISSPKEKVLQKRSYDPSMRGFWPMNADHTIMDQIYYTYGFEYGVTVDNTQHGNICSGYRFYGNNGSYIYFHSDGQITIQYSFTLLVYAYPTGVAGPIIYGSGSADLWQTAANQALLRIRSQRDMSAYYPNLTTNGLVQNEWNFIGATYDYNSGEEKLYLNGAVVNSTNIGSIEFARVGNIVVGAVTDDARYYKGLVTCMQLYDRALSPDEIIEAEKLCTKCPAVVRGDPHLTTFDGRAYSFQGTCWYTLVKDCLNTNPEFEIRANFAPRDDVDVLKTRTVAINVTVGEESIIVDTHNTVSGNSNDLKFWERHIDVSFNDNTVMISFTVKDTTFTLRWKGRKHIFTADVSGTAYHGKVCGLLGNADGDSHNDFMMSDGKVSKDVNEFGESWKVADMRCE
ncbi:IgGFc-binding protein-like [Saccoglossus kowalevskii]|uniref:IgGFc-binding protein-like n=1 Tax=Saccoglossus kowalevskii TaxID=10224 RepID=A0ABM0GLY7_SACKO|nr:PREDICTED: IgGFc-binding protein-like [Saccoglossus kowalevskii]